MSGAVKDLSSLDFSNTGLVDRVSATLTKAILEGIFKGGERLIESKLQEQLGISRSPVREAFRDLEKKGLVVIVPRRGTFVRKISLKDIQENFPVRAALEGLAARESYSRLTDDDLDDLKSAFEGMRQATEKKDRESFMKHHLSFHDIFINASGNEVLINIFGNLRMHNLWFRFSYRYYKEDFEKSLKIHAKIFRLFKNKRSDEKEIERLVRWHIEVALDRFLDYLREETDGG